MDDGAVARGRDLHGLLKEPTKELASAPGTAPIEAEGEFVRIVVEMLSREAALVGAQQPPLEEARNQVHARHHLVSRSSAPGDVRDLVLVPLAAELRVAAPGIGVNRRARVDHLLDELVEARLGGVGDRGHADAPDGGPALFRRDRNQGLRIREAADLCR